MSGFFGRSSVTDPAGITTGKYTDPFGVNAKYLKAQDKILDPGKTRYKFSYLMDPGGITDWEKQNEPEKRDARKHRPLAY